VHIRNFFRQEKEEDLIKTHGEYAGEYVHHHGL